VILSRRSGHQAHARCYILDETLGFYR